MIDLYNCQITCLCWKMAVHLRLSWRKCWLVLSYSEGHVSLCMPALLALFLCIVIAQLNLSMCHCNVDWYLGWWFCAECWFHDYASNCVCRVCVALSIVWKLIVEIINLSTNHLPDLVSRGASLITFCSSYSSWFIVLSMHFAFLYLRQCLKCKDCPTSFVQSCWAFMLDCPLSFINIKNFIYFD